MTVNILCITEAGHFLQFTQKDDRLQADGTAALLVRSPSGQQDLCKNTCMPAGTHILPCWRPTDVWLQIHVSADGAAFTPTGTADVGLALLSNLGQLCGWYNLLDSR